MSLYEQVPLLLLLLLPFVVNKEAVEACADDELYVIRSVGSNGMLVLDGSEPPKVAIQFFTGFSPQLWQFKRGSKAGLYYIVNNHTGNALDFVKEADDLLHLTMNKRKDTMQQQWSLTLKNKIINAANKKYIDVLKEKYVSGGVVHVGEETPSKAQEFDWQMLAVRPNYDYCKYLLL